MSFSVSPAPRFAALTLQNFSTATNPVADDENPLSSYEYYTVKATDTDLQTYKGLFQTSDTLTFIFGADHNSRMHLVKIATKDNAPNQLPAPFDKRQEAVNQARTLFTQLLPMVEQLKIPAHLGFLAGNQTTIVNNLKWLVGHMQMGVRM